MEIIACKALKIAQSKVTMKLVDKLVVYLPLLKQLTLTVISQISEDKLMVKLHAKIVKMVTCNLSML